jgi:hypothetical protein
MLNLRNMDVQPTLGLMVECTKALDLLVNNMEKAFMSADPQRQIAAQVCDKSVVKIIYLISCLLIASSYQSKDLVCQVGLNLGLNRVIGGLAKLLSKPGTIISVIFSFKIEIFYLSSSCLAVDTHQKFCQAPSENQPQLRNFSSNWPPTTQF